MSIDINISIQYWSDDVAARIDFRRTGNFKMVQAKNEKDLLQQCLEQIEIEKEKNGLQNRIK